MEGPAVRGSCHIQQYLKGVPGFHPAWSGRTGSTLGWVQFCRAEERVREGSDQVLEPEPNRVERAPHPLPRVDTDRGTEPVGEPAGDRGRLVDVAMERKERPMRL